MTSSPSVTPRPWNTPQILRAGLVAVCLASLLFLIAAVSGARIHRQAMRVVGKDSAPSIIAAQHIGSALADMDASAVNELLNPADAVAARKTFEERRTEAVGAIVTAAQNITYGDAERAPILKLATGTGTYVSHVQEARDLRAANSPHFIEAYREAAKYMDTVLLPAAADLDHANRSVLDTAYSKAETASGVATAFLLFSALMLVLSLLGLQMFLSRRMRRILNPMLLLATIVTGIFTIYAVHGFRAENRELRVAKEDAFESIHALWRARSLAYSANSDESRYLLDPAEATAYEKAFNEKADQIARLQPGRDEPVGGLLEDELNNITFMGEREAAAATVASFVSYRKIDQKIRALEQAKSHQAAIALCVGNREGESNQAFERFDQTLGRTLEVNQQAFDGAVDRGFHDVAGFEVLFPITALVISLLAWLGLKPRLREYTD